MPWEPEWEVGAVVVSFGLTEPRLGFVSQVFLAQHGVIWTVRPVHEIWKVYVKRQLYLCVCTLRRLV